jgi:hypothetical protein
MTICRLGCFYIEIYAAPGRIDGVPRASMRDELRILPFTRSGYSSLYPLFARPSAERHRKGGGVDPVFEKRCLYRLFAPPSAAPNDASVHVVLGSHWFEGQAPRRFGCKGGKNGHRTQPKRLRLLTRSDQGTTRWARCQSGFGRAHVHRQQADDAMCFAIVL